MNLQTFAILLLTQLLINESHQKCSLKEFRKHETSPYFRIIYKKYIYCESTPITVDFHKEVQGLVEDGDVSWIEFTKTQSTEIPKGAFNTLRKLSSLRLNDLSIRIIQPGAFDGLLELRELLLTHNKIVRLDEYSFNLTRLEVLDLSHNSIAEVSENAFQYLKNLKTLNLQNNFITHLPPNVFRNLSNLEILDLSVNKLTEVNDQLKELKNLKKLQLNDNNLHEFKADLSLNPQLEIIELNNNYLIALKNLFATKALLNVSHNLVQELKFGKYSNFESVDLSFNGIVALKSEFFDNLSVKKLCLDHNYLTSLPKTIFTNLSTLSTLSLKNNGFKTLNADLLRNNTELTDLYLDINYLSQIDFYLPDSLRILGLSHNYFEENLNLSSLVNLHSLDLSYNKLKTLSFHFLEQLKKLNVLNLSGNQIGKVAIGAFRNFKALSSLNLSHNNISRLELGTFVGIENLWNLDLSYNKLDRIEEGIFHNMRNLQRLNVAYNNISFLSVEDTLPLMYSLREVGLAGNNWACASLAAVIKKLNRNVGVIQGGDHNVTNVNGIACHDRPKTLNEVPDLTNILNNVDSKLSTNNSLLICILIVLIVILVLKYILPYVQKRRFVQLKNEQEIQLL